MVMEQVLHFEYKAIGVLVSGLCSLAALFWFVKKRPFHPRALVAHEIVNAGRLEQFHLMKVFTTVTNVGLVPITIEQWYFWVYGIIPLDNDLQKLILERGGSCLDLNVPWPVLVGGEYDFIDPHTNEKFCYKISPSESEQISVSFLIPNEIKVIQIQSHIPLSRENRDDLGWKKTELFNFEVKE